MDNVIRTRRQTFPHRSENSTCEMMLTYELHSILFSPSCGKCVRYVHCFAAPTESNAISDRFSAKKCVCVCVFLCACVSGRNVLPCGYETNFNLIISSEQKSQSHVSFLAYQSKSPPSITSVGCFSSSASLTSLKMDFSSCFASKTF